MPEIFENSQVIQKCLEKYKTTCIRFHIYFSFFENDLKIFLSMEACEKGGL